MASSAELAERMISLGENAFDFCWSAEVPRVKGAPDSLTFCRDWVQPNRPVIFENAFPDWPCLTKWTPDYLGSKLGDVEVSVAVTPNGYADAITDDCFVMPEERSMPFNQFLDVMREPGKHQGVFYVQKQNSNFTTEFEFLHRDAESEVSWASEAFGKKPEAVNFWMGDGRAVTSMHRDHYENIYLVISGSKTFTLIPPTDVAWVPYKTYPAAKFASRKNEFVIEKIADADPVPWIAVDPLKPDLETYPEFKNAHVIKCEVKAGEALYLPSMWFHHVQQSHGCIALNYWYDMEFDLKYVYYKFAEGFRELLSVAETSRGVGDS